MPTIYLHFLKFSVAAMVSAKSGIVCVGHHFVGKDYNVVKLFCFRNPQLAFMCKIYTCIYTFRKLVAELKLRRGAGPKKFQYGLRYG